MSKLNLVWIGTEFRPSGDPAQADVAACPPQLAQMRTAALAPSVQVLSAIC